MELIVLNVGLSAGILDTRTFSMFVLHALVLTFITTPLTLLFYPSKYRTGALAITRKPTGDEMEKSDAAQFQDTVKHNFAVVIARIEQLPILMTLTQLLQHSVRSSSVPPPPSDTSHDKDGNAKDGAIFPSTLSYSTPPQVSIDILRLIELTDRTSAVLKSQSVDIVAQTDPVLSIFRTFAFLNRMTMSESLRVVPFEEFAPSIGQFVREASSQMVILPWICNTSGGDGNTLESPAGPAPPLLNPFDNLFGYSGSSQNSVLQTQFFRRMFATASTDVALYVDRGLTQHSQAGFHIFLPFFGGPDDRLALSFVAQLCMNASITATVVRFVKVASDQLTPMSTIEETKIQAQTGRLVSR